VRNPHRRVRGVRRGRRDHHLPHGAHPLSRRTEKVNDLIQSVLADLLRTRVKHPVLTDAIISIVEVDVSPDLARATVHVGVIGDEFEPDEVLEALRRSEPFLHREMVRELHLRRVPRLRFRYDGTAEEADRLTALMRELAADEGRPIARPTSAQPPERT
jgi:ribosome-binding factor A